MKKALLIIPVSALLLATSCFISIKETESVINKNEVKEKIGRFSIAFKDPGKKYMKFIIKKTRDGIIADRRIKLKEKNNLIAHLDKFKYEKGRFFLFRIRHGKAIHREKGAAKFTFVNAKGESVMETMLDTTLVWTGEGTLYEEDFIFKLNKPLTKETYSPDTLPLTFTANFLKNQKKVYKVSP